MLILLLLCSLLTFPLYPNDLLSPLLGLTACFFPFSLTQSTKIQNSPLRVLCIKSFAEQCIKTSMHVHTKPPQRRAVKIQTFILFPFPSVVSIKCCRQAGLQNKIICCKYLNPNNFAPSHQGSAPWWSTLHPQNHHIAAAVVPPSTHRQHIGNSHSSFKTFHINLPPSLFYQPYSTQMLCQSAQRGHRLVPTSEPMGSTQGTRNLCAGTSSGHLEVQGCRSPKVQATYRGYPRSACGNSSFRNHLGFRTECSSN